MTDDTIDVLIVGAGLCGLACARHLSEAGLAPVVLEKGRGVGGRAATRRSRSGYRFDHGAQYFTARSEPFRRVMESAVDAGAASRWDDGSAGDRFVGVEGMADFARHMAGETEIRLQSRVSGLSPDRPAWRIETPEKTWKARRVVITAPAPQIGDLVGDDHEFSVGLSGVELDPCLTLMAATDPAIPAPFQFRSDVDEAVAWIACDSAKPGRETRGCWVLHATPEWSRKHLELDKAEIAERLLPLLCEHIGCDPGAVRHRDAHRWRYAKVAAPLGEPFLRIRDGSLYAGGDWCLDARVEAAWTSGEAIARDLISRL